jgi:uncharacterized glyoxalase superfamily protein PhnB
MNERGEAQPAGPGDRIALARLEVDGTLIVRTDGHPTYLAKVGEHMAIALSGTDRERISRLFGDVAEGGRSKGLLTEQPWGGATGYLEYRIGVNWVVSVEKA